VRRSPFLTSTSMSRMLHHVTHGCIMSQCQMPVLTTSCRPVPLQFSARLVLLAVGFWSIRKVRLSDAENSHVAANTQACLLLRQNLIWS